MKLLCSFSVHPHLSETLITNILKVNLINQLAIVCETISKLPFEVFFYSKATLEVFQKQQLYHANT